MVRVSNVHTIAPIPDLLLARSTEGLYYDLVGNSDVRRVCGSRFEDYCCMILRHYLPDNLRLLRDQDLKVQGAPDIVIESTGEGGVELIIECKARRLSRQVLSSPKPQVDHQDAFEDLVKGVLQIWKFVAKARRSKAGLWKRADFENTSGLVLTLDPWVQLGTTIIEAVLGRATMTANSQGIDEQDRIPVSFAAMDEFERTLRERGLAATCRAARRLSRSDRYGYLIGIVADEDSLPEADPPMIKPFPYREALCALHPWSVSGIDKRTYDNLR